jgi:O-antigen/teichoic acid export membrane protein
MLPKEDQEARSLLSLTIRLSVICSALAGVAFFFVGKRLLAWIDHEELAPWLWLIPINMAAIGIYQGLYYYTNRLGDFRGLAVSRVLRGVVIAGLPLVLGLNAQTASTHRMHGGLVLGLAASWLVGCAVLAARLGSSERNRIRNAAKHQIKAASVRYQDFPKFSVLADTINSISVQVPVMVLQSVFGPAVAGQFALVQRVIGGPMGMIAASVGDVYKQRAASDWNERGNCEAIFGLTAKGLLAVGAFVFGITFLFGPSIFAFVFGEQWRTAGQYAVYLVPFYFLGFAASPLSRTLFVAEKQRWDLAWQIALAVMVVAALAFGTSTESAANTIIAFSVAYAFMYVVLLAMSHRAARGPKPALRGYPQPVEQSDH